jgi:predicted nucleic acid-binding protein
VLVYLDSSVLARAYLADEPGHADAGALLRGADHLLVSGTWTRVEVTSALVRASRAGRLADLGGLLAVLASDTSDDGPVTLLRASSEELESRATQIVAAHALRSLDALHLAYAELAAAPLAERDEPMGFASRDAAQTTAAEARGFVTLPGG